jgi:hypothetical protein
MAPPPPATLDPVSWLLCLCAAMFAGAFGSGYIPLYFSWSERRLRLVTIFGAGLLVGTALVVIIPEGVAMHYEGQARRAAERAAAFGGHDAAAVGGAAHAHAHGHAHGRRLLDSGAAGDLALAPPAGAARALMSTDSSIADTIANLGSKWTNTAFFSAVAFYADFARTEPAFTLESQMVCTEWAGTTLPRSCSSVLVLDL